jgi:hypothetical protein
MAKQFLDKHGLSTFLAQLRELFATNVAVAEVKQNTDAYILSIDYESVLGFDTNEIISDIVLDEDITLAAGESLMVTATDEILVDANNTYVIIEGGE